MWKQKMTSNDGKEMQPKMSKSELDGVMRMNSNYEYDRCDDRPKNHRREKTCLSALVLVIRIKCVHLLMREYSYE